MPITELQSKTFKVLSILLRGCLATRLKSSWEWLKPLLARSLSNMAVDQNNYLFNEENKRAEK